jgi:MSHA biogenesis protein MshJ
VKRHWEQIAEKIDALSLRERGLVFFSVVLVVFALLYSVLLQPVLDQQRVIGRNLSQQESQIRVANLQLSTMVTSRGDNPDAANRKRLDEIKRRIAEARQSLALRQSTLVAADRMAGLLEDLVARNTRLELVGLKTLPPGLVFSSAKEGGDAASSLLNVRALFRHGVEVTVRGSYFDLLEYVRQLEGLQTQLLWGKLDLSLDEYPKVTMKLTLYTLSLDRAWLVV